MTASCLPQLCQIAGKPVLARHDAVFCVAAIREYFRQNRPQEFAGPEPLLTPRFAEILQQLDMQTGISFAGEYFLFVYSLADEYKQVQERIETHIARPYRDWLLGLRLALPRLPLAAASRTDYLFLCRHATISGGYAPGGSVYSFSEALLASGARMAIASFGQIDSAFMELQKTHPGLSLFALAEKQLVPRMEELLRLIVEARPRVILTEIEFDLPSVLSILQLPVPIIYLSAGYYCLPWYDRIGLTTTLSDQPAGNRQEDYFEIPTFLHPSVMNPPVAGEKLAGMRAELGISPEDFVFGAFARMEKFSPDFLDLCAGLLACNPRAKLILAGPNDRQPVTARLADQTASGRALILGQSDAHLLGNLMDCGLDTFPTHSGFSVMELMAKSVPVLAWHSPGIDGNWKMRCPASLFDSKEELKAAFNRLVADASYQAELAAETARFMQSQQDALDFVKTLNAVSKELQNRPDG